jgi:hypothetical protein
LFDITQLVVKIVIDTEMAFCSAFFVTLRGSIIPKENILPNLFFFTSYP